MLSNRAATEADKPFLIWLEEACMRDYAIALWGAWSQGRDERSSIVGCQIIAEGDCDVGCITIANRNDHLWVDEFFIAPAYQRRGFGSKVLRDVIADAIELELSVRLSVLTTNPAVDFYLRHGFQVDHETTERLYLVR